MSGGGLLNAQTQILNSSLYCRSINEPCAADEKSAKFCQWLRKTVSDNYQTTKSRLDVKLNSQIDSYWFQIYLYYLQLEGIEFGWRIGLKRSPMKRSGVEIPLTDILIMNLGSDLPLLEDYYNAFVDKDDRVEFAVRQRQAVQFTVNGDADRIDLSMEHRVVDE